MDRTLSPQRRALLPALALLHLLVLMSWQRPVPRPAADHARREGELILLQPAPPLPIHPQPAARAFRLDGLPPSSKLPLPPPPATAPSAPPPSAEVSAAPAIAPPDSPPAATPAAPQPITLPADDPFAAPSAPDTLLARSRRAVAAIDRDLRKERHLPAVTREPELATKIAAAAAERGFGMTERVLPNGDVIAKVRTPFTSYCVLKTGPNPPPGRSPGQTLIVTCPK